MVNMHSLLAQSPQENLQKEVSSHSHQTPETKHKHPQASE